MGATELPRFTINRHKGSGMKALGTDLLHINFLSKYVC